MDTHFIVSSCGSHECHRDQAASDCEKEICDHQVCNDQPVLDEFKIPHPDNFSLLLYAMPVNFHQFLALEPRTAAIPLLGNTARIFSSAPPLTTVLRI